MEERQKLVKEEEEEIVVDIKLEKEKNDPPKVSRPGALKLISLFNSFPANASGDLVPPSSMTSFIWIPCTPLTTFTSTLWPDAWTTVVGDVWQLLFSGHSHYVAVVIW